MVRVKLFNNWFVFASYVVIVVGLLIARMLLPSLAHRTLEPDASGVFVSSFVNSYLPAALSVTVGCVVLLECCTVFASMFFPNRSLPNTGSQQTTPR